MINVRVVCVSQAAPQQGFQSVDQQWCVLSVHILHALESTATCLVHASIWLSLYNSMGTSDESGSKHTV